MIARDRTYDDLLDELKGKKVLIWTCNTCARLCNDVGGDSAAERVSEQLSKDGVTVVGIISSSASCLKGKAIAKADPVLLAECDIVLSLTCEMGALCAKDVFGKEVVNPLVTLGFGYMDENRVPIVCTITDGETKRENISDTASRMGYWAKPFF